MHTPTLLGPIALSLLACCENASAQLTISEPQPTLNAVRQVSAAGKEGIVAARRLASSGSQIRVTVQYLMVDEATCGEIYEIVQAKVIKSSVQHAKITQRPSLRDIGSPPGSSQQTRFPCWLTTAVLDDAEVAQLVEKAEQSKLCDISRAPSVSLLDGQEAEMSDIVQRPFVVSFQQLENVTKPVVDVLDEGTRLRMLATVVEPSPAAAGVAIDLTAEIAISRILDIKSDQIYGLQEDPLTVHVPIHQVTTSIAAQRLIAGQTFLLDPHVSKTKTVSMPTAVPIIGKIPYVSRRFQNRSVADVEQRMLVLLKPSIEKTSR